MSQENSEFTPDQVHKMVAVLREACKKILAGKDLVSRQQAAILSRDLAAIDAATIGILDLQIEINVQLLQMPPFPGFPKSVSPSSMVSSPMTLSSAPLLRQSLLVRAIQPFQGSWHSFYRF